MRILLNDKPPHVTFENDKRLEEYDTASECELDTSYSESLDTDFSFLTISREEY